MKLRPEVTWHRESVAPGFLIDHRNGGVFGLNGTAAEVLEGLEAGEGQEDLTRRLSRKYEVFELAARCDVACLLDRMERLDLVQH